MLLKLTILILSLSLAACGRGEFGNSTAADDVVSASGEEANGADNFADRGTDDNNQVVEDDLNNLDPQLGATNLDSIGLDPFDLYRLMAQEEGSFVFSPHALNKSLLTLHAASAGSTRGQFDELFGLQDVDPTQAYDVFSQNDDAANVSSENAFAVTGVWVDTDFDVSQAYVDIVANFFDVTVRRVNLQDVETARVQINNTLRAETAGFANEVLPTNALPSGDFVVAGATYFDAAWQIGFDETTTEEDAFVREDGSEVPRQFMTRTGPVLASNDGNVQSIALPLTTGQSVVLILPTAGIESIEDELGLEFIERLIDQMQVIETTFSVPKMDLSSRFDLDRYAPLLDANFLVDTDASYEAAGPNAQFGSLLQLTRLSFNESGLETPPLDGGGIDPTANVLRFDRPFVFAVIDVESQTVLYLGRLLN